MIALPPSQTSTQPALPPSSSYPSTSRALADPDSANNTPAPENPAQPGRSPATVNVQGLRRDTSNPLQNPPLLPASPEHRDYWGLLSRPVPLSPADQERIKTIVNNWIDPDYGQLFGNLAPQGGPGASEHMSIIERIEQLIASPKGQALGAKLQTELECIPTATSIDDLIATALILQLVAHPGGRNRINGYDLNQPGNWGKTPAEIKESVSAHLLSLSVVPPYMLDMATHMVLAHIAPALLVPNLPEGLVFGSVEWATYSAAVSRIEQQSPGASVRMTFDKIIAFGNTRPTSPEQEEQAAVANRNALSDWAIANGFPPKSANGGHSLAELQTIQSKFTQQVSEINQAVTYAAAVPPTRQQIVKNWLRRALGPQIDVEREFIKVGRANQGGPSHSILELAMAGLLKEPVWSYELELLQQVLKRTKNFPDVEAEFNEAVIRYHGNLVTGLETQTKLGISKLCAEDREIIENGHPEYFSVQIPVASYTSPGNLNAQRDKNTGRHGVLLKFTYKDKVRHYEIFSDSAKIYPRADIPETTKSGPSTIRQGPFGTKGEGGETLPLDLQRYTLGTPSSPPFAFGEIVLKKIEPPSTLRAASVDQPVEGEQIPQSYSSARSREVASVVANHLIADRDKLKSSLWGITKYEKNTRDSAALQDVILNIVVPFKSAIQNAIKGEWADAIIDASLDILGFLIPTSKAVTKATKITGTTAVKLLSGARLLGAAVLKAANPLDGIPDLLGSLGRGVKRTASAVHESVNYLRGAAKRANLAQGALHIGDSTRSSVRLTGFSQDGKWYAFDPLKNQPYGPPLSGFRSDTSIALRRETFSNGTDVLSPERLFPEDALVINRASHADLQIGNKVYRYDPKKPDILTDLESADNFKNAQGMEAFCPAGRRAKRGLNDLCFAKVISDLDDDKAKLVQALEHVRLYPSPANAGKASTVIYDRRLFDVVDQDGLQSLVPRALQAPIDYLPTTRGTIIKDPHFGLSGSSTLPNVEQNTRIVKLDAISSLSNDQRELRGTIALQQTSAGTSNRYVVVEADPLTFYYSKFDADSTLLDFKKIGKPASAIEQALVNKHIKETESFLELTGAPLNKEFFALPSLDKAFAKLENAGYTPAQVNELKATVAPFSDEKKREFVFQLINKLDNSTPHIVHTSSSSVSLNKSADFANLSEAQQNKFYADAAKDAVDKQVKATGIGSRNKRNANSFNDQYREEVAETLLEWIRGIKRSSPNYVNSVLKFGAGNCGEMAAAATHIIKDSAGKARTWYIPGGDHAFTVVGGPPSPSKGTVNFSEPEWKDAWIVDPWADISCKASDYTNRLKAKMTEWRTKDLQIYAHGDWRSPEYPKWVAELTSFEKRPI